jgi:hypothetical protein
MSNDQTVEIAAYDMGYFPETQDESTEIGKRMVAKQFIAIKKLIEGAFQDVFHKNWEESFMADCTRLPVDDKEVVMYKNRPFLELGEMEEDFAMKNGTQHLIINQNYRVL